MADEIITRGGGGPPGPPIPSVGVTYYQNTSSSDTTTATDSSTVFHGLSEIGFSNGDYIFTEWNTASDGSGTAYYPNELVPYLPLDVYAIWKDPDTAYQATFGELNSVAQAIRAKKYQNYTTEYYAPLEFPTEFISAIGAIQTGTPKAAQTYYPATGDQIIASGYLLTGNQTFKGVLLTNLTAGNIKKNVVVRVGDSADDDRITSVTGTYEGSGGGGSITGLVYESGTWTPSEDVVDYTISFTDTHTTAPFYYVITDDSATYSSATNSNFVCMFFSPYLFCGAINMGANSSTGGFYAYTWHRYRATDANTLSSATNTSFTVESNISNWATSTGIRAYCTNGTRYWRTARTYKWVAVWAPET